MYKDVLDLVNSNSNIIIYDKTEYNCSSVIMQLMLTNYAMSNITIIDKENEINFIKQNFKIGSEIDLFGYDTEKNIIHFINKAKLKQNNYIVIQHKTRNQSKIVTPELFNYAIHVYDKENYDIKNLTFRQSILSSQL